MQAPDSYALATDAQAIVERLLVDLDEFAHLTRARLVCVHSQRQPMLHGTPCHAFICDPRVQGPLKWIFDWLLSRFVHPRLEGDDPDYLILIDAAHWSTLTAEGHERLMYHELCHVQPKEGAHGSGIRLGDDGRPLLKLVPHDAEVFNAELLKYGPEVVGIADTCVAIAEGAKAANARERDARRPRLVG